MKEVKLEGIIYRYDPRESAMSFDFPDPNDVNGSERRRDFVLTIEDDDAGPIFYTDLTEDGIFLEKVLQLVRGEE